MARFPLLTSKKFLLAMGVAFCSGGFACMLRFINVHDSFSYGGELEFLKTINPDHVVFNVFIVFASLVASFRTSHALVRYVDAAALMHRQSSCWFNAVLSLLTYTRNSTAPHEEVKKFHQLSVRLFSLVSGLCLKGLEHKEVVFDMGHDFDVLGWNDLSEHFQNKVLKAPCKVEYVFQSIDAMVMAAMVNGVMIIPPPILVGVFNEMGAASSTYHEAKKFSKVPLPFAYLIITRTILVTEAVFVPFILAEATEGYVSAFLFTFGGTFMLWFINGIAENLDNPFKREAFTLEVGQVQDEFNTKLLQLLEAEEEAAPCLSAGFEPSQWGSEHSKPKRQSMHELKHTMRKHSAEGQEIVGSVV